MASSLLRRPFLQASPLRTHFHTTSSSRVPLSLRRGDRLGSAAAMGYFLAVISAPLAGAFFVSENASKDQRLAKMRPLSFRNCLPGSSLEDFAGVVRLRH